MRFLLAIAVASLAVSGLRADETDDQLARQLGSVVRDPRPSIWARVEAARTLAKLGPRASAAVPDLVAVLGRFRGPELEPLQEAIVEALGQIGSPAKSALPALALTSARSVDIDQAIKRSTVQIVTASDTQDVDALIRQLVSRDASVRLRATKALGQLGIAAQPATGALVATLGDPDGDVRRGAITALRLIYPNAKVPEVMIRAIALDLTDVDPNMRLLALRALSRIGAAAGIVAQDIDNLRGDPDPDVRRAAGETLNRVVGAP